MNKNQPDGGPLVDSVIESLYRIRGNMNLRDNDREILFKTIGLLRDYQRVMVYLGFRSREVALEPDLVAESG